MAVVTTDQQLQIYECSALMNESVVRDALWSREHHPFTFLPSEYDTVEIRATPEMTQQRVLEVIGEHAIGALIVADDDDATGGWKLQMSSPSAALTFYDSLNCEPTPTTSPTTSPNPSTSMLQPTDATAAVGTDDRGAGSSKKEAWTASSSAWLFIALPLLALLLFCSCIGCAATSRFRRKGRGETGTESSWYWMNENNHSQEGPGSLVEMNASVSNTENRRGKTIPTEQYCKQPKKKFPTSQNRAVDDDEWGDLFLERNAAAAGKNNYEQRHGPVVVAAASQAWHSSESAASGVPLAVAVRAEEQELAAEHQMIRNPMLTAQSRAHNMGTQFIDSQAAGEAPRNVDMTCKLVQLANLHSTGALTDEEFAVAKREVLPDVP